MIFTQGLVQVYTGNGKGKTTAAFGLALRAIGGGGKVAIVQFMKGRGDYGELAAIKQLAPACLLENYGAAGWVHKDGPKDEHIAEAQKALARAREVVQSGNWDLVILDEVINAVWFGLLPEAELFALLDRKPQHVEVVLTGRNASQHLKARADLVTEMVQVKHPFEQGIAARKGIEF